MNLDDLHAGFATRGVPGELIDELLASFQEVLRRFHLGDYRPNSVEAGRFSEAVVRILQWRTDGGQYTPLGRPLPTMSQIAKTLANVAVASEPSDAVRIHIPRTLQLVYDIRSKRDVVHLGDGIDPNLQDSSVVVANMRWVLAELVRLYHDLTPDRAQAVIEDVVSKDVPAIQEIAGRPVILKKLPPRDQQLLLLYRAGARGVSVDRLAHDLKHQRKDNLRQSLRRLEENQLVSNAPDSDDWYITWKGEQDVEKRELARPA